MNGEQILALVLSVGGTLITALSIIVYRQYNTIYSDKKSDLEKLKEKIDKTLEVEKLIIKLEKTNELSQEIIDDFKVVINNLQTRLTLEEFKLESYDETNTKLFKQIEDKMSYLNKKLQINNTKLADLDLEIKLMKKDLEE